MQRLLDDWITTYMEYVSNSEPPEMYHLWSAIVVISSALKRKCRLDWGSLTFYPNMYVSLVGPPATRKGTAMNFARPFLEELNVRMAAEATTREALIKALQESNDTTVTADGQMYFHSSLTIWSQELTVFLGHQNFQLLSDLTDWYDCRNQWTYRTKNMGTDEITGVYVTLYGATTPDLIRTALPMDAIGGGLTSRFIFVNETNKGKIIPYPGFSDKQKKLKLQLSQDLDRISMLCNNFKTTKEFLEYWIEWYPKQERNPPIDDHKFAGYLERRANHIMKLSMIVNASRTDNMIISVEDLTRAISILEHTERNMQKTFSGIGQLSYSDILTRIMNDVGMAKSMLFSEILYKYKSDVDKWRLEQILNSLTSSKFAVTVTLKDDIRVIHRASLEEGKVDRDGNIQHCGNASPDDM